MTDDESAAVINIPQYETNGPFSSITTSSCISTITFDDSVALFSAPGVDSKSLSKHKHNRQLNKQQAEEKTVEGSLHESQESGYAAVIEDEIDFSPLPTSKDIEGHTQNSLNDLVENNAVKGSLYARIMNGFQDDPGTPCIKLDVIAMQGKIDEGVESQTLCVDTIKEIQLESSVEKKHKFDIPRSMTEGTRASVDKPDEVSLINITTIESKHFNVPVPKIKSEPIGEKANGNGLNLTHTDISTHAKQRTAKVDAQYRKEVADQWREVHDNRTGKVYFYNRRTRESRWSLPTNAVLLRKKRQIRCSMTIDTDSDKTNSCGQSSSESSGDIPVLDTSSSSFHDSCSKADTSFGVMSEANMCHLTVNERRCTYEDSSLGINDDTLKNGYGYGGSQRRDIIQGNDAASQMILDRCRKLRESFIQTQKTRFFFPNDSKNLNDTRKEIENEVPVLNYHSFYCMYCGAQIPSASVMDKHLHLQCPVFLNDGVKYDGDEHIQLQRILKELWSSGSKHPPNNERLKENVPPITNSCQHENLINDTPFNSRRNFGGVVQPNCDELDRVRSDVFNRREEIFSLSDDEETILNYAESRSKRLEDISNENRISSLCPFCEKSFSSGSSLSEHLLKCKLRQKSNKKRSVNVRRELRLNRCTGNKLQAHFLTNGGRHLPGHPRSPPL